ncbi:DNA-binding transcriptional regulator [Caulobacter sp. S45]|uniref:helix-turn-helix domain-containing protein n=1 Tax=Caulobacter sp. S45 TaxID=1641861 RepID=UPI001575D3F1|nr:transcriptional regulator [Caulobacter sp. S45]
MSDEADFGHSDVDTEFGRDLLASVREALAHKRGEIELPYRVYETMPATRVKEIRRKVAKSPKEFERRFHIPARTLEGWEQGRRAPDVAARVLLTVIEKDPEAVERALS